MPVIKVYGVPDSVNEEKLRTITDSLVEVVVLTKELKLTGKQVSVFFPTDRMKWGLGEEVIAFVEGLFDYPERTSAVLGDLAFHLGRALHDYFPNAFIECFVVLFDPSVGYYSYGEPTRG